MGIPKFKRARFAALPIKPRVGRKDPLADLASKTRAEAILQRPARSPKRETAITYAERSLDLRVPTKEELSGQLSKTLKSYKEKRGGLISPVFKKLRK